jgi:hypothetical protein
MPRRKRTLLQEMINNGNVTLCDKEKPWNYDTRVFVYHIDAFPHTPTYLYCPNCGLVFPKPKQPEEPVEPKLLIKEIIPPVLKANFDDISK